MKLLNTLFEITIYSAVLFAAVTGFKLAFKNKLSPALHFTLWFLVIARLCIPMTIESGFHLFTVEQEKPLVQQQIPEVSAFDAPTPAAMREAAPSEALHSEASAPVQEPLPAADSPKPVFTIASADALIALWVAGMAFRAAALLFGERRLHLAMAHNTLPTDARTRDIYDACCAELGIAHKLPLQSMAGIYSPALTVSLKPMILLPANITDTLTDAQLACALRHELTHYRRRDHLLMLLLRLLTCVYWFNPIVWLMKRELMKDMETACDSAVTARLNGTERREYAMTLLALFSQPCRANSVLGMALSSAKKDAERRVREVFGAHRSKAPVKILAALLSALLLACCFTTACQPTPSQSPVVNKGGDYLEGIEETPFEPYAAESHADRTAKRNGIRMQFDADVIIPETGGYAVYEAERLSFTAAEHMAFIEHFLPNAALVEKPVWTKEYYAAEITKAYQFMALTGRSLESYIERLKQQMDSAPENAKETPLDLSAMANGAHYTAYAPAGENVYACFAGEIGGDDFLYTRDAYCRCYDEMMLAADAELSEQYGGDFATEPAITEQDAVKLAEQSLTALGIEGMKPLTCSRMCVYGSVGDIVGRGWAVTFTRDCGGLTVPYDIGGSSGNVNDVPALSAPWGQEVLTVGIDSAGICYFTLKGACTVTKKLYANVPLLSYDELLDRIENQLFYHHAFSADGVKNPCITVKDIRLCAALVNVADRPNTGRFIPAFEVAYSYQFTYGDSDDVVKQDLSMYFNAIDGSYIEPRVNADTLNSILSQSVQ